MTDALTFDYCDSVQFYGSFTYVGHFGIAGWRWPSREMMDRPTMCCFEAIDFVPLHYKQTLLTMMKSVLFLLTLASASAFAPAAFGVRETNT